MTKTMQPHREKYVAYIRPKEQGLRQNHLFDHNSRKTKKDKTMFFTSLSELLCDLDLHVEIEQEKNKQITLTIIPRKNKDQKETAISPDLRPISLTGSAQELDEEFSKGKNGALGSLFSARKSLSEQIREQTLIEEEEKKKKEEEIKKQSEKAKTAVKSPATKSPTPSGNKAEALAKKEATVTISEKAQEDQLW